jgi:5,10-methylenetetrahydromethanopterin reductase
MAPPIYPELGFYALPGHAKDPKRLFDEIAVADQLGLGSAWISERFSTKHVAVISGAAAARTSRMGIAAGLMANMPLRHPLVTAGYASTMMKLTDNRFALGVGRGVDYLAQAAGVPKSTFKIMEDYISILRRLWRGEVVDYSGPLGTFSGLVLGVELEVMPPIIMAACGDKTCYWAGRWCDGVIYDSLWSAEAVRNSTRLVRRGAADAGRDPSSVKVWTILMTACNVSEESMLNTIIRRMNTYLLAPKSIFDAKCIANGWDIDTADRAREELRRLDGPPRPGLHKDEHTTQDLNDLRCMQQFYPAQWIDEGTAIGSPQKCAEKIVERFAAGADGILFHAGHPANLQSLLHLWPDHRPQGLFDSRSVNPGR